MEDYSVYRIDDPHEDDFHSPIDADRLILSSRHYFENDREVMVETYDGNKLLSRSVSTFNEKDQEVEVLEYMENETIPFKIVTREFNEMGLVVATIRSFGDDEPIADLNAYDDKGRLLQTTAFDDDGEEIIELYTYESDCPKPSSRRSIWLEQESEETRFRYEVRNGEYEMVEEILDHKIDTYRSRVKKYYGHGVRPHGVIEQVYNSRGELLEECREVEDIHQKTVKLTWHTDSDPDSEPYKIFLQEFDASNRVIKEEWFEKGMRTMLQLWKYDSSGRLERKYSGLDPDDSLEIYKYGH